MLWIDSVTGAFRHESISVEARAVLSTPNADAIPVPFLCMTALLADDDAARSGILCYVSI